MTLSRGLAKNEVANAIPADAVLFDRSIPELKVLFGPMPMTKLATGHSCARAVFPRGIWYPTLAPSSTVEPSTASLDVLPIARPPNTLVVRPYPRPAPKELDSLVSQPLPV